MVGHDLVTIRTERAGDGLIKVVWTDSTGAQWPPYRLYSKLLKTKADLVRGDLRGLYDAYLHPKPNFTGGVAKLADSGRLLRKALFEDHPPEDRNAAAEPMAWFEDLTRGASRPIVMTVHADPILPLPWGLLHEFGSGKDDFYEDFWALRHKISTLYSGMAPQHLRVARTASNVRLLSGLNETVFDSTRQHLAPPEREFISAFLERPVGQAFSTRGCRERWAQVGDNDCIIYFFGHASGQELRFSESDRLTANQFRQLFRPESRVVRARTDPSYVLSFLNGCASVSGEDSDNFLIATADPGFCGFIGAEAPVPDRFALLFGQELLYYLFFEGLSVREAMSKLWRKHNPMALFYGSYAHPDFTLTLSDSRPPLPSAFTSRNFHPLP